MSDQKVNILLVEDNPHHAELAMRALKIHNVAEHFVWVKTGEDATDFIFCQGEFSSRKIENTPKVVILDLKLPRKSGLDVLREIRADERTRVVDEMREWFGVEFPNVMRSIERGEYNRMGE